MRNGGKFIVKNETKEKVENEIKDWSYMDELPTEWFGFSYCKEMCIRGDFYDLYSYTNEQSHRSITVYYHEETSEYKLRVKIGLTEFCRIEYIAGNLAMFESVLRKQFSDMLHDMAEFNMNTISCIVKEKKILEWDYIKNMPETIEGFVLFIRPDQPVKVINGSYIVFAYCDFEAESDFIIYYNVFRDEFFGEARVNKIPEMNYTFDSTELSELEEKLDQYLVPRLKEIRQCIRKQGSM